MSFKERFREAGEKAKRGFKRSRDWTAPRLQSWWRGYETEVKGKKKKIKGRREEIRWGRSFFFTTAVLMAYGVSILLYGWFQQTYLPEFLILWVWRGWNWFFWPALLFFWIEEIIGPETLNIWPKGLATAYSGIFIGSLIMAVLSLATGHGLYLKEAKGIFGGEQRIEAKIQVLEKELAEVVGSKQKDDDGFSLEDEFVSGKESRRRPAWITSLELQKFKAQKMARDLGGSHVAALGLRFKYALSWLWWGIIEWLPTYIIFALIIGPVYGVDAVTGRIVQLVGLGRRQKGGGKQ